MSIVFQSFGAAQEVTGSKHLIQLNDKSCLVDCGMFQGKRAKTQERNSKLPFEAENLDSVVLSHGHFDHCGNLPSLKNNGYDGNIYATAATRDIANLIMMDSAHIMAKDHEFMQRKHPDKKAYEPIYDSQDVLDTLQQFMTVSYDRQFKLPAGASCRFLDAGHILGSSVVLLENEDGRVAFTGDLGRPGLPILKDPQPLPPVDYLICEGTYGNRLHDPIEDAQQQLGEVIRQTVNRGGKVVIPSFAVGRTQELVYFLHLLKDQNQIPADLEIFVDSPMAVNATSIFRVHQECYDEDTNRAFLEHHTNPFGFEGLRYVSDVSESKALNTKQEPCIIISSSGMCEAGRILHHLKNNIPDSRNTVLIVGFMAQHTLGRRIADREPEVKIFGDMYPLKAQVKILNTFSAHADYNDIKNYVSKLDLGRLKRIYLVHGETDALENLQQVLKSIGVREVEIVVSGKKYQLF